MDGTIGNFLGSVLANFRSNGNGALVMNQQEISEFFDWCQEHLAGAVWEDCDESQHFYVKGVYFGGYAGDSRQMFFKHSDELAAALRMMDAHKSQ